MHRDKAKSSAKVKRRHMIGMVFAVLFGLLLLDGFAYPYFARPSGPKLDRGENGLWLRYTWYFGLHPVSEIPPLAQRLHDEHIQYAYFHVRGITKAGTLAYHDPVPAKRLVTMLHQQASGVQVIAWIYAGNKSGIGEVDLSQPAVRKAMASEARWLTTVCGFDGVQWDYEICPDNDPGFLELLQETRSALPLGKSLGAAVPMWLPAPLRHFGWSDAYFTQVAAQCDQLTVMSYDSGMYLPRAYVWLVHQQVVHVTTAVARGNPHCRVLIGLPTYGKGGLSHDPYVENIRMALIGVREGLADPDAKLSVFAGVAPFADYTTQPSEWQTYQQWWLNKATPSPQ